MIRTQDEKQIKRLAGRPGDRIPTTGVKKNRVLYTAVGGETSINLALLSPVISYAPGQNQIAIKRSSGGALIAGVDFFETSTTTVGFPVSDPLIAGEIVEIAQDVMHTGLMAVTPRPDCYTTTATALQTVVSADFSWPYNINPTKSVGAIKVFVQGFLWKRGVEYTEVNMGTGYTNQILVADGFVGGEDIVILPAYEAIDQSAGMTTFYGQAFSGIQNMLSAATNGFVDQSTDLITVPNTTIVGRAKIPNLANDLRASFGIERIPVQSIMQLQNEFGQNGEPVYSVLNDDRGLIRCVGNWVSYNGTAGQDIYSTTVDDYIEIVFYGTGLNVLTQYYSDARDMRASIDGGAYGSNIYPGSSSSGILSGRSYNINGVLPVNTTALSLGIHTIRIKVSSTAAVIYGFEILNANASGLININPGTGYLNGNKYVNTVADSIAYTTGVTGTKGGRVVRYLNADGTASQAFQAVDSVSGVLAGATHTNEEVARVYNFREFGAGRADDFSLLTSNRAAAFTLDDGTTTLVGNDVSSAVVVSNLNMFTSWTTSSFFIITFVGTGLDITGLSESTGGTLSTYTVAIDGGTATAMTLTQTTALKIYKVASGLPYGTHTAKFTVSALGSTRMWWKDFIVYQPKKPTLPSTALEICDYNVMANYDGSTATGTTVAANVQVPQGVLAKQNSREFVYVGANWTTPLTLDATMFGGFIATTGANNSQPFSYTWFGTGIVLQLVGSSATYDFTVTLDTALNASGVAISNVSNSGGGTYQAAIASGASVRLAFTGLSLGIHTISVQRSAGSGSFSMQAVHLITPIHSHKSNLYADLQNTLPVGSNSLMDSRKTSLIKEALPVQKAWAQAVAVTAIPSTSATSPVPLPDMSVTVKVSGGPIKITANAAVTNATANRATYCYIYVDGVAVMGPRSVDQVAASGGSYFAFSETRIVPVSVGVHKVDVYYCTDGAGTVYAKDRSLVVQEL